jgi:hypothetical protein
MRALALEAQQTNSIVLKFRAGERWETVKAVCEFDHGHFYTTEF